MRRLFLVLVLTGCSAEEYNAFRSSFGQSMRGGLRAVEQPRECYDRSGCNAYDNEVCMIPQGQTTGQCVKVR